MFQIPLIEYPEIAIRLSGDVTSHQVKGLVAGQAHENPEHIGLTISQSIPQPTGFARVAEEEQRRVNQENGRDEQQIPDVQFGQPVRLEFEPEPELGQPIQLEQHGVQHQRPIDQLDQ